MINTVGKMVVRQTLNILLPIAISIRMWFSIFHFRYGLNNLDTYIYVTKTNTFYYVLHHIIWSRVCEVVFYQIHKIACVALHNDIC